MLQDIFNNTMFLVCGLIVFGGITLQFLTYLWKKGGMNGNQKRKSTRR